MGDIQIGVYEKAGIAPLHIAAGEGNATLAKQLLDNGANVNVISVAGFSPLLIAASFGNCFLVRLFLENGADPNIADENGKTALDHAAENGCQTCQRLLLACSKRKRIRPRSSANVLELTVCEEEDEMHNTSETLMLDDNSNLDDVLNSEQTETAVAAQKHKDADCNKAGCSSSASSSTHTGVSRESYHGSVMDVNVTRRKHVPHPAAIAGQASTSTAGLSLEVSNVFSEDDESFDVADMVRRLDSTPQQYGDQEIDWASFLTEDVSTIADASTLVNDHQQQLQNIMTGERQIDEGNNSESTIVYDVDDYPSTETDTAFIRESKNGAMMNDRAGRRKQLNTIVEVSSRFEKDLSVRDHNHAPSVGNGVNACLDSQLTSTLNSTFVSAVSSIANSVTCRSCGSSPAVCVTKHLEESDDGSDAMSLVEAHLLPDSCQCHGNKQPIRGTIQQLTTSTNSVSQSPLHAPVLAIEDMSNVELHRQLVLMGEQPGPITLTTRKVYELRLRRLLQCSSSPLHPHPSAASQSSPLPLQALATVPLPSPCKAVDNIKTDKQGLIPVNLDLSAVKLLETEMHEHFSSPAAAADIGRRGRSKTCFNYVLLDPRVTCNLPARARNMDTKQAFALFLESVFYVGKGTSSRPFAHFKEAVDYRQKHVVNQSQPGSKVWHILDIWNSGHGVVCLSVFHNAIAAEALTREACMISALGKSRLTNLRQGTCYGLVAQWPVDKQCQLGLFLLRKAFYIFLLEGERQIFPDEL